MIKCDRRCPRAVGRGAGVQAPPGETLEVGSEALELSRHGGRECWPGDGGEGGECGTSGGLKMSLALPLDRSEGASQEAAGETGGGGACGQGQSYFAEPARFGAEGEGDVRGTPSFWLG